MILAGHKISIILQVYIFREFTSEKAVSSLRYEMLKLSTTFISDPGHEIKPRLEQINHTREVQTHSPFRSRAHVAITGLKPATKKKYPENSDGKEIGAGGGGVRTPYYKIIKVVREGKY